MLRGICKDEINNSCWNKPMKNDKASLSNADPKVHPGPANQN